MRPLSEADYGHSTRPGNPLAWMDEGVCQSTDPELFFADEGCNMTVNARLLCLSCPVLDTCRAYSLRVPGLFGVWGGTTKTERKEIRCVELTPVELRLVESEEAAMEADEELELVAA